MPCHQATKWARCATPIAPLGHCSEKRGVLPPGRKERLMMGDPPRHERQIDGFGSAGMPNDVIPAVASPVVGLCLAAVGRGGTENFFFADALTVVLAQLATHSVIILAFLQHTRTTMADLIQDPNLQSCPDFASPDFLVIRNAIIGTGPLTDAEATEQLHTAWQASNDAQKILWGQQVQRDRDAADATRVGAIDPASCCGHVLMPRAA
ncbi:hypothetical protein B0H17DRAFT_1137523 [Mycena rosella]|uniref:Uncharacterized protein n=1 Tax=Mycena rosella TaxID=1033263 RepID=A0AAD7D8G0_MYCRO|nr:hypothetical protein B0H17DRAFT_1137523 [Mycena rosella]